LAELHQIFLVRFLRFVEDDEGLGHFTAHGVLDADNGRFFIGLRITDDDGSSAIAVAAVNVVNVPPVIPFSISENWNVISRTIVPLVWQSDIPREPTRRAWATSCRVSSSRPRRRPPAGGSGASARCCSCRPRRMTR
jgi:hypothetical protein